MRAPPEGAERLILIIKIMYEHFKVKYVIITKDNLFINYEEINMRKIMNLIETIKSINQKSESSERIYEFSNESNYGRITSELFCNKIPLNAKLFEQKNQIYKEILSHRFYITLTYSESFMDLINSMIATNSIIVLSTMDNISLRNDLINKKNVVFKFNGWIDLEILYRLATLNKLYIQEDDYPVIVISKIDESTKDKIKYLKEYAPYNNFRYRIEIDNQEDLLHINSILSEIPDPLIYLSDDLFDNNNFKSARNVVTNSEEFEDDIKQVKDIEIYYLNIKFTSLEEIIEFEKYIDVLFTRISPSSTELDKIVFITLFMINYFSYDHETTDKLRTPLEFIKDKKGVCRDYSKLTKILLNRVGIGCEEIYSYDENNSEGHAYNVVYLYNQTCFLDVTWVAEEIQQKLIKSIIQSVNYLTGNEYFGISHSEYEEINDYECTTYDRNELQKSIARVSKWKYNYYINKEALFELLKKGHRREKIEREIESALPGTKMFGGK